jgi:steroid delta-isomerase
MDVLADPRFVATVEAYFSAIRDRDESRWLATFSEDAVCHDPVGATPAEGRASLHESWGVLTAPFKKLIVTPCATFYCGTGAAVHWASQATGVNEREASFEGITVFEFATDGRIQTLMAYWDPAAMMIELAG